VDRRAVDPHFPVCGVVDAGDHIDQCRFPTARLTDDADKLPLVEGEINFLESLIPSGCGLIDLCDLVQIDRVAVILPTAVVFTIFTGMKLWNDTGDTHDHLSFYLCFSSGPLVKTNLYYCDLIRV